MDMVDYSVAEEDNYREALVAKARKAPQNTSRLKPVGYCYNCYEDVQGNMLFCDNRCADEYHYRNKLK